MLYAVAKQIGSVSAVTQAWCAPEALHPQKFCNRADFPRLRHSNFRRRNLRATPAGGASLNYNRIACPIQFIAARKPTSPRSKRGRLDTRRHQELKQEVESLRKLRRIAGKAQADIATALKIKQPSVSKIEKQADMYLSTLRSYVEAIGGELELVVKLPKRPALRLQHFGDAPERAARGIKPKTRRSRRDAA